jgi:hypothetical protein
VIPAFVVCAPYARPAPDLPPLQGFAIKHQYVYVIYGTAWRYERHVAPDHATSEDSSTWLMKRTPQLRLNRKLRESEGAPSVY